MTLHINQRVMTPLGPGTILGFEIFINNGMSSSTVDTDREGNTGRVHVRLDTPGNWLCASELQPHPFMYRSQLSELNES